MTRPLAALALLAVLALGCAREPEPSREVCGIVLAVRETTRWEPIRTVYREAGLRVFRTDTMGRIVIIYQTTSGPVETGWPAMGNTAQVGDSVCWEHR
jgi:hypothetical protein